MRVKNNRTFAYSSPQTGSVSKMRIDTIDDDIWVKSGNLWFDTMSKTVSEKDTLDGKPVISP